MTQLITKSAQPDLTKCKYWLCDNLVSNVDQKTRRKEYCCKECRDKTNNEKKVRGYHTIQAEQIVCIDCKLPVINTASTRCNQRKICPDCTIIRTRRRSRELYWRRKNV